MQFLFDHVDNLDINVRDRSGHSALEYSCQYGHNDIIHLLLQRPEVEVKLDCIQKRSRNIESNILKQLIDHYKLQSNALSNLLAILAKDSGSLHFLQYAMDDKSDCANFTDDVFLSACQGQNNIDTVNWFLNGTGAFKSKINTCTDSQGMTGLMHAAYNQGYDAIHWVEASYDDGADYMRVRDPPETVVNIIRILKE